MHTAITRPLASGDATQRTWTDGRPTAEVIAPLVKPNAKLEAIERLEIYNRMYWFRLLDCVAEDCPGLRAFLGETKFWALVQAYLTTYPSRSYTLRNLCARLPRFITEQSQWTEPFTAAALDIARFEWAQIVAFDGAALKPFSRKALASADPEVLRVKLQPYLSVLRLDHAVDDYVMAVKHGDAALRGEASQAVVQRQSRKKKSAVSLLKAEKVDVVVHRSDEMLYYKRIEPEAARLLQALGAGHPIAKACARAMRGSRLAESEQAEKIQQWFALWMRLSWLCPWE